MFRGVFKLLVVVCLLFHCVDAAETLLCTNGTLDDTCTVKNSHQRFTSSISIVGKGKLVLKNSTVLMDSDCIDSKGDPQKCMIYIDMQGDVTLSDSSVIEGVAINITGKILSIDKTSAINGAGQGAVPSTFYDGSAGRNGGGGGHAGSGGRGCDTTAKAGKAYGSIERPRVYGGSGQSESRGGGIIWAVVNQLQLDGTLIVDGDSGVVSEGNGTSDTTGAAGGSVYLQVATTANGTGKVSAKGGWGTNANGGGSGGVIHLHRGTSPVSGISLAYAGGGSDTTKEDCQAGAGGLLYTENHIDSAGSLYCYGGSTQNMATTEVPVTFIESENEAKLVDLVLTNCHLESPTDIFVNGSIVASSYSQITRSNKHNKTALFSVYAQDFELVSNSKIVANELFINSSRVTVDSQSQILFTASYNCYIEDTFDLAGIVEPQYSIIARETQFVMVGGHFGMRSSSLVKTTYVYLNLESATIEGSLSATFAPTSSNCSQSVLETSNCYTVDQRDPYRNVAFWASVNNSFVLSSGATITSGGNIICAHNNITLRGVIDATQGGCPPGEGKGGGHDLTGIPGSGAGHAGKGGAVDDSKSFNTVVEGGKAYGSSHNPSTRGSGGGVAAYGGAGGGMVFINTTSLSIEGGQIKVSGMAGHPGSDDSNGGGGGAGGSLNIHTGEINFPQDIKVTAFDVGGGAGANEGDGAGGGSGGHLFMKYDKIVVPTNVDVNVAGGKGFNMGRDGASGGILTDPTCDPGFEGFFCSECEPGSYKPNEGNDMCQRCPRNSKASSVKATSCVNCTQGQWSNPGAVACNKCQTGKFRDSTLVNCTACEPGKYADQPGMSYCKECGIGTYSGANASFCEPCAAGTFSHGNAANCSDCTSKPVHSSYIVGSEGSICAFRCDVGLVKPDCLTPFNELIRNFGGAFNFGMVMVGLFVVLSCPFVTCWCVQRNKEKRDELAMREQYTEDGDFKPDLKYEKWEGTSYNRCACCFSNDLDDDDSINGGRGFQILNATEVARFPPEPITESNLTNLVHRFYLAGFNTPKSSLHLPRTPDPEIQDLLESDAYATFAEDVKDEFTTQERTFYWLLCVLYFPFAHVYARSRRKTHIENIWREHFASNDHHFFSSYRAKTLGDSLRFGFSKCLTVAWLDVLCDPNDHPEVDVGSPCLPSVLVCNGDGTFFTPFCLDPTDVHVKSFSAYFGPNWFSFLASLNSYLREITPKSMFDAKSVAPMFAYISLMNKMGIGIGPAMPISGVQLEAGFVPGDSMDNSVQHPRLAIVLRTMVHQRAGTPPINSYSSPKGTPARRSRRSQDADAVEQDRAETLTKKFDMPSFDEWENRERADERKHYQEVNQTNDDLIAVRKNSETFVSSRSNYSGVLPYGTVLLQNVMDTPETWIERAPRTCFPCSLLLRNVHLSNSGYLPTILFVAAVLIYFGVFFLISLFYIPLVGELYYFVLFLMPLMPIIATITGLVAVIISSPRLMRFFLAAASINLVNCSIAVTGGVNHYLKGLHLSIWLGVALPLSWMVSNLLMIWAGQYMLAQVDLWQDTRQSRQELIRKEIEDTYVAPESPSIVNRSPGSTASPRTSKTLRARKYESIVGDAENYTSFNPTAVGSPM